ncbi:MAG: hypothetical protein V1734_05385 [Nanoarchaeota archaeon]
MNRIIGDRREKSALDDMIEVSRQFNEEIAEEERRKIEKERRKQEEKEMQEAAMEGGKAGAEFRKKEVVYDTPKSNILERVERMLMKGIDEFDIQRCLSRYVNHAVAYEKHLIVNDGKGGKMEPDVKFLEAVEKGLSTNNAYFRTSVVKAVDIADEENTGEIWYSLRLAISNYLFAKKRGK